MNADAELGAAEAVELEVPTAPGSQAIVRSFAVAAAQAWACDEETTESCRVVAGELFAFADGDRVALRLRHDDEGRTVVITAEPASIVDAAGEDEGGLRIALLGALTSSIRADGAAVVVVVPTGD